MEITATGTTATESLQAGLLGGVPALRFEISCAHGSSASYLLAGSDERRNEAAVEILRARHGARVGCGCAAALPSTASGSRAA